MPSKAEVHTMAVKVSKQFADEGRLIEAGWASFRVLVIPANAPQIQIDECRMAFMAGAQHLFGSIMNILDPDLEPSVADMKKMGLIDEELKAFGREIEQRIERPR